MIMDLQVHNIFMKNFPIMDKIQTWIRLPFDCGIWSIKK